MKNLITRTITGAFFVAIIIGSMILHPLSFAAVIFVIMVVGLKEFYKMVEQSKVHPQKALGYIAGSVVYLIPVLASQGMISPKHLAFLPGLVFIFFITELFRKKQHAIHNVAFSIFGVAYISIPLATLSMLLSPLAAGDPPTWHILFALFIISWSNDTFAYLTGIWLGKHKLFERISPKKTWEGTIGGTLFALLAAYILAEFFYELTILQWMGGALVIVVSGTFGDLSESMLKRKFEVKDSGNFFPGHGGVLDRFDSVLFSAPAFFCYLILLNL